MEENIVTNELKAEPKIAGKVFISTFFFLLFYWVLFYNIRIFVHSSLMVPYTIFAISTGIFLTTPSLFNRKRKMYQSIFLLLKRNRTVYRPVLNVSANRKREILIEKYKGEE